jgi:predicted anti-sigma-YlaC factor YlaD
LNREQFTKWIKKVYATEDNELDCNQTQFYLPAFVEAEFSGNPLPSQAHELEVHLNQCPDCKEVYLGLHFLLQVEANNELLEIDHDKSAHVPVPPVLEATRMAS